MKRSILAATTHNIAFVLKERDGGKAYFHEDMPPGRHYRIDKIDGVAFLLTMNKDDGTEAIPRERLDPEVEVAHVPLDCSLANRVPGPFRPLKQLIEIPVQ